MALPVPTRPRYPEISPKAYEHPADRAATAALGTIPLLERLLKWLSEVRLERTLRQLLLADAIQLGERQLPDVWQAHIAALDALDIGRRPDLYVSRNVPMNALTIGSARPVVLLDATLINSLSADQVAVVLDHEAGHVLSEHVHYATVLATLQRLAQSGLSPIPRLPLRAVVLILLEWYRCAELSCDRAAALVTGDPLLVCATLMRVTGGGVSGLDLDAFLAQASAYAEEADLLARPGRWLVEIGRTHPFAVRRVGELMRWVQEGEFDRIRSGSYIRRGQEPPTGDQFRDATEHYRKRFLEIVDRVTGGAQKLAQQVTGWLRGDGGDGDGV